MKGIRFFWISLIFILLSILGFLAYSGLFARVVLSRKTFGPNLLIYVEHKGDYRHLPQIRDSLLAQLRQVGIEGPGFALFFDQADQKPAVEMRSWTGLLVPEEAYPKIPGLGPEYLVHTLNQQQYLSTSFPLRNGFSQFFGVLRVYPKINGYLLADSIKPGPSIEIYDTKNERITYLIAESQ